MRTPGPRPSRRVLVVESDEDLREMVETMLRFFDCEPTLAATAEEALQHAVTTDYCIVFIDHGCEGIDGQALFHALSEARPELTDRVVFLTSVGGELPEARQFLAWAGRPTISRPFGFGSLETIVREMIPG
jgi:DNA-binding response OmpR family regulator